MLARTLSKLLTCSWLFATLAYAGLESTRNNVESDSRLPYFKVSGSYYDVGYKVGSHFKERIHKYYEIYESAKVLAAFAASPEGKQRLEKWTSASHRLFPNVMEEMKGLAAGAAIDFQKVFLYHAGSEVGILTRSKQLLTPSCSDIVINRDGVIIDGHNEDADLSAYNTSYILDIEVIASGDTVERFVAFAYAGIVPGKAFAFNSHGLTFACNAVFGKHINEGDDATPRPVYARALLSSSDLLAKHPEQKPLHQDDTLRTWAAPFSVNVGSVRDGRAMNIELSDAGKSVEEVTNGFSHHFNMLLHSSTTQYIDESSVHRAIALLSSPGPRDVNSTLTFLSDTSDKQYPIFRNGGKPDYVITVATVMFDIERGTADVYTQRPLPGARPAYTFSMSHLN